MTVLAAKNFRFLKNYSGNIACGGSLETGEF